jgi:methylated-DNA-protein-cysteine methyltransferase-like protein
VLILAESIAEMRTAIWQVVSLIPAGKVASYGQVAALAGLPQQARLVGRILSKLPKDTAIPCHRVVNATGKISNPNPSHQIERLAKEGLTPINGRINLRCHRWQP